MKTIERAEAGTQTTTKFEPKDLLQQVVIAGLAVAPDGRSIVYVKRTVEDGKYMRRLWRTDFEGAKPEQLTSAKASDQRPRFSPDGRRLVFISDRTGKPQAWLINLAGGEPRMVTDLPGGVGAAEWAPDGTRLLLLAGSGEERFIAGNPDDPTARAIRDYTWRMDGMGIRDEHTSVWVTDVHEGTPRRITEADYNVSGAAWSPDGSRIAFLADRSDSRGLEEIDAVWMVEAGGGEPVQVARLAGGTLALAWAPGKDVAYLGVDHEGSPGWADMELHVGRRRLAAGRNLNIQRTSYGDYQDGEQLGSPSPHYEDEKHLVALVAHRGYSHPYRFGIDSSVERLASPEANCSSIAVGGGRVAVIAATSDQHNEVFAVESGSLRKLTGDGSSWYGPFARDVEHVEISHPEGHAIDTWLIRANCEREVAPLVIVVHGGPNASFGPTPWLEMNALADAGIHVVYCNPRGSVSYGETYAKVLEGQWGHPDGRDLLRVIDWAVDQERITDRQKVGIMGLSYGGFMANWMLANHPGVFAAAVSENPVTDLLGEWATSDFGRFIARAAIGVQSPWENIEAFVTGSPFARMHLNHAPLLLLHAENDLRCPPGNSEIVFHILRTLGREVEMVRYPGEAHMMMAIGRPDRRVDRLERIVSWFSKHLTGAAQPQSDSAALT